MRTAIIAFLGLLSLTLQGCTHFGVYRPDVQQGNVYTPTMIQELHAGMDKDEVLDVMGSPVLKDMFAEDRWTYVSTMQKNGGKIEKHSVTLFFQNDRLLNWQER